jgi:regulator of replication initiation timing
MPQSPQYTPEDVQAGKAAFDAAGVDEAGAMKLADELLPKEDSMAEGTEEADPWDAHMGKSIGEDWGKTPDSVKSHIRGLHDLLADSDLPDATEDMLEKEVKDVTDAAADGDKEKMIAELEDLKSKLAEMETANGSLKSENDKYQKHLLSQLVKHLRESVAAEAPDLADDEEVMKGIDAYYDALKDDADLFEHAPNAVMVAIGTARKNGKKAPEPKVEPKAEEPKPAASREEGKAAAADVVAGIPGLKRNPPAMSETSAGDMPKDAAGKKKNYLAEWMAKKA